MVLADREKEGMDEELRHSLKGYKLEWHTRSGVPHCSSDLERVAAGQAKNIILLDDQAEVTLPSSSPAACLYKQSIVCMLLVCVCQSSAILAVVCAAVCA